VFLKRLYFPTQLHFLIKDNTNSNDLDLELKAFLWSCEIPIVLLFFLCVYPVCLVLFSSYSARALFFPRSVHKHFFMLLLINACDLWRWGAWSAEDVESVVGDISP